MERMSIFVGFTPYHAYVARNILEQLNGRIYCAFSKIWPTTKKPYIRLGPSEAWPAPVKSTLCFLHLAITVHHLMARGYPLDIYIPHPGHIMSNYLFFGNIPGRRLYLYEDGLLNYCDVAQPNPFVNTTKRLLARIGGLPYRDYIGHIAGYDAGSYDGAFLSTPEQAVRKECLGEVHRLLFPVEKLEVERNLILFLDQNVSSRMSATAQEECINAMFAAYPKGSYQYFYKPHHDHASHLAAIMDPLDSHLRNLPAELVIERLRPSHVVSFFSSALVNIKRSWPQIHCVSLAADHITISRNGTPSSLRDLFEGMGVTCLEIAPPLRT